MNGGDELVENTSTLSDLLKIPEREVRSLMDQWEVEQKTAWKGKKSLRCWHIPLKTLDEAESEIQSYTLED